MMNRLSSLKVCFYVFFNKIGDAAPKPGHIFCRGLHEFLDFYVSIRS